MKVFFCLPIGFGGWKWKKRRAKISSLDGYSREEERNLENMGEIGNFRIFLHEFPRGGRYLYKNLERRENPRGCCLGGRVCNYPLGSLPPHSVQSLSILFPIFWFSSFSSFSTLYLSYFMSNFVFLESFGCLVSIGFNLLQFGTTVVMILHLKVRWSNVKFSVALFLGN